MTNFRKLCDELLDELKYQTDWSIAEELKERARAALAEPESEGPTDEELLHVFDTACLSEGGTVDEIHLRGLRAVLARWGK